MEGEEKEKPTSILLNKDKTDIVFKQRIKKGVCKALNCTKKSDRQGLCHKHRSIRFKVKDTLKYAFKYHRQNALKRGHKWLLTFEEFTYFWTVLHPEHWENKRKNIISENKAKIKARDCLYEMDRINPQGPYALTYMGKPQLQCVSKRVNVSREWDHRRKVNIWTVIVDGETKVGDVNDYDSSNLDIILGDYTPF